MTNKVVYNNEIRALDEPPADDSRFLFGTDLSTYYLFNYHIPVNNVYLLYETLLGISITIVALFLYKHRKFVLEKLIP